MSYEKISAPIALDFPDEWYGYSSADHFWLRWRMQVFQRLALDQSLHVEKPLRVLEIGCGHGVLRLEIEAHSKWTVDGADINEAALQRAAPGRGRILLYNIEDRLPQFHDAYDGVILFDVLEHIKNPESFLAAACWHLKPGGWVLINVPALRSLYSLYDQTVGHFRRYDSVSIQKLLESSVPPLTLGEARYWGFSLIPVAWVRKVLLKFIRPEKIVETGFKPRFRWINSLLWRVMQMETACLRRPALGTSIMAIARKAG